MAIARDSTNNGVVANVSSLASYSHTCTGSNLILFVMAVCPAANSVTSITYNSVAMSLLKSQTNAGSPNSLTSLYYLAAPATGANTVSVQFSGGGTQSYASSVSYTGCAQSGIPDSSASTSQFTTAPTEATTVVASNCWLVGTGTIDGTAQVLGPGFSGINTSQTNGGNTRSGMQDSGATVGTGSQSLSWTNGTGGNFNWSVITASIAPAASAGGTAVQPSGTLSLMGMG